MIVKHKIHRFRHMSAAHVTYILFYIHRLSVMLPRVERDTDVFNEEEGCCLLSCMPSVF